jgi:hypothetical protein
MKPSRKYDGVDGYQTTKVSTVREETGRVLAAASCATAPLTS